MSLGFPSQATGTWNPTGSFATPRYSSQMVLLPNGNVLAAGGNGPSGVLASAEVYNTTTGTWTTTAPLATARSDFQMLLLPSGSVLAAGGSTGPSATDVSKTAELYSAATGSWTTTTPLFVNRRLFQMVLLPNGDALAAAGYLTQGPFSDAEVYTTGGGFWTTTGYLALSRYNFQMIGF